MNLFALSGLLACISSLIFGIFSWIRGKKFLNKIFAILNLFIAIWGFGAFRFATTQDQNAVFFWLRFGHIGVILIPVLFIHFVFELLEVKNKKVLFITYFFGLIFFVLNITDWLGISKVFIVNLRYVFNSFYVDSPPGPAYCFFAAFFFSIVIYTHYYALKYLKIAKGIKRMQLKYFLMATAIAYAGGGTSFLMVFKIDIYPIFHFTVFLYPIIMSYAIFKYRLMDIKLAVTRFGLFVFVYTFVLGVPFLLGYLYGLWKFSTWLMLFLATSAPFIYMKLEKQSKELMYKTEFRRYEILRKFTKTMLRIKELSKLVELIVYRLVKTLKVSYAAIYLYDKEIDSYILKSHRPLQHPNAPKEKTLTKEDNLIKLLLQKKKEVFRDEITEPHTQRQMRDICATLIIPHFLENELLGFLVLGDKEKGLVYTEEDISILSALSNTAASAIENTLFLIDLKLTQAELFDTKRLAELGYMASAMGHEINNRLQAIYNAAFDMIDNPVIYDIVKNNPQTKEAFDKDIRHINENIEDAGKIINELKAYARPQDKIKQKFEPLSIKEVIDKAVTVVRLQSVKAFDMISLDMNIPQAIPKILGNFIQLQQVFVNMLNNAHDAILQKKDYIAHHSELAINYIPKININIGEQRGNLNIHIIDNGIGMTEEVRKRIFVPLYTSKATSQRKANREIKGGTGIGLYTIQTIVKGHKGTITINDTKWLEGTDFIITLPVAKEALS